MKLINVLIICFSLITPAFADPIIDQQKAACAQNTSKEWDDATNTCKDKTSTTTQRNAVAACMDLADLTARQNCMDARAREAAAARGVNVGNDSAAAKQALSDISNDPMKQSADILGATLAIMNMVIAKKIGDPCTCKNIFAITALGGILTDKFMKKDLAKKLDEIKAAYKIDSKTTTYDAQKKALEYLRDVEAAIADIAGQEEKRLQILALGYAAASLMAIWESTVDTTCYQTQAEAKTDSKPAVAGGELTGPYATLATSLTPGFTKYVMSPPGIIVLAGIGFVITDNLKEKAAEQKKNAENNVATLERIIRTFTDSWVDKCPAGREDLANPNCYCYKEDGTKNPNRTNSQTCINLWNGRSNKIAATETNYDTNLGAQGATGCVALNGQFDTNCQCKKLVNPSGGNACLKTTGTNIAGINPLGMGYLTGAGFGHVTSNLDSAANGANNIRSLNSSTLANALAKQKALNSQLFKQAMSDPEKKGFPDINNKDMMAKIQNTLFPPAEMAKLVASAGGSILSTASNNKPPAALAAAIKKVTASNNIELTGGQGLNNKKGPKVEPSINFGENMNAGAGSGAVTQNFADKTYNYKENDIVKKPDVSIFEIISNRYVESGLKRLFDDK